MGNCLGTLLSICSAMVIDSLAQRVVRGLFLQQGYSNFNRLLGGWYKDLDKC